MCLQHNNSRLPHLLIFLMLGMSILNQTFAQCTIDTPSPQTSCSGGPVTFNAVSWSSTVNHHVWYDANLNPISPSSESAVILGGTTQARWISSLTVYPNGSTTYYVAASCNTADKRAVSFSLQSSPAVNINLSSSSSPGLPVVPYDLCQGDQITLTATAGSNWQWRFNNSNDSNFTGGQSKTASQSGTYYLTALNGCGQWVNSSVALTFNPAMSGITLDGPGTFCQGSAPIQFTTGGFNFKPGATQWLVSDTDDGVDASVSGGQVTFNNVATNVELSMTVWGCRSTSLTLTKTLAVNLLPYQLRVYTEQKPFCIGTVATTVFTATGDNVTGFTGWSVTGKDNTINSSGVVTWNPFFSGTATISVYAIGCNETLTPTSTTFTVLPNPQATISPAGTVQIPFRNDGTNLSANGGYNYQWMEGENSIDGATSQTYFASEDGIYRVRVNDPLTSCYSFSPEVKVSHMSNYNYIVENILLDDKDANGTPVTRYNLRSLPVKIKNENIQFFDGIGRPMQSIIVQGSPLEKDVVQPIVYDGLGRTPSKYLPYVSGQTNGAFKEDVVSQVNNFYEGRQETFPVSKTIFESSPLNRVIKQGAPGSAWQPSGEILSIQDKTIKARFDFNGENEIYRFNRNSDGTVNVNSSGTYYGANELSADKTYDEINHVVIEYKDKEGRLLCKKVQSSKPNEPLAFASTYYIYDDFGNLVVVLPPEGVKKLMSALNLTDPAQ